MNILAPMPRKSFLFASTSFEMMCQWPMVTPASLNGAGCAAAGLTASAVANTRPANTVVFIRYLPVEPNFTLGLPCDVNAISPRECGKASPGGIFLRCRSVARMEPPGPAGACHRARPRPDPVGQPDDKLSVIRRTPLPPPTPPPHYPPPPPAHHPNSS